MHKRQRASTHPTTMQWKVQFPWHCTDTPNPCLTSNAKNASSNIVVGLNYNDGTAQKNLSQVFTAHDHSNGCGWFAMIFKSPMHKRQQASAHPTAYNEKPCSPWHGTDSTNSHLESNARNTSSSDVVGLDNNDGTARPDLSQVFIAHDCAAGCGRFVTVFNQHSSESRAFRSVAVKKKKKYRTQRSPSSLTRRLTVRQTSACSFKGSYSFVNQLLF